MKPETEDKINRLLLSIIFITTYIFLFVAVIAKALDTNLYNFLLG